jgi:hypothetical protein
VFEGAAHEAIDMRVWPFLASLGAVLLGSSGIASAQDVAVKFNVQTHGI